MVGLRKGNHKQAMLGLFMLALIVGSEAGDIGGVTNSINDVRKKVLSESKLGEVKMLQTKDETVQTSKKTLGKTHFFTIAAVVLVAAMVHVGLSIYNATFRSEKEYALGVEQFESSHQSIDNENRFTSMVVNAVIMFLPVISIAVLVMTDYEHPDTTLFFTLMALFVHQIFNIANEFFETMAYVRGVHDHGTSASGEVAESTKSDEFEMVNEDEDDGKKVFVTGGETLQPRISAENIIYVTSDTNLHVPQIEVKKEVVEEEKGTRSDFLSEGPTTEKPKFKKRFRRSANRVDRA